MELIFNLSESILHIIFINNLIVSSTNKKKSIIKSVTSILALTSMFSLLTFLNIDNTIYHCLSLIILLYAYTYIRNINCSIDKRSFVSITSVSLIYFSGTIAFGICDVLFSINRYNIIINDNIFDTITLVIIMRLSYVFLAIFVIYFYKNKLKNIELKNKYKYIILLSFLIYSLSYEFLLGILPRYNIPTEKILALLLFSGILIFVIFILFYFILKSNKLSATIKLQQQKEKYDTKDITNFYKEILEINKIREEIIVLLTPFAEVLNDFEYGGARQLFEDFFSKLDIYSDINYKLEDTIDVVISLKTELCKKKNITLLKRIKSDKKIPSIFNTFELVSILSTLFDMTIQECEKIGSSICFTYNTQESGIFLIMEYESNDGYKKEPKNVDSILDLILEKELSDIGGYSVYSKNDNKIRHTVILPYVGKSYYLKGSKTVR